MTDIYRPPESDLTVQGYVDGTGGSIESTLAGRFEFSPPDTIGVAFGHLKGVKRYVLLATLVYMAAAFALGFLQGVLTVYSGLPDTIGGAVALWLFEILTQSFILMPLFAGGVWIVLRHLSGRPLSAGLMFSQLPKAGRIGVMYVMITMLLIVGFLLLILPGIYLAIAYSLALPLMIDRDMSPWQAMETSRKLVSKCWWRSLAFVLLIGLILLASAVFLFIPLIWTLPAMAVAYGLYYRSLAGIRDAALD